MTSKLSRLSVSALGVLLVWSPLPVAAAPLLDGFSALIHATQSITGPGNNCKKVTNESPTGLSVYVPTSTLAEWQSFGDHPPTGISLGACGNTITIQSGTNLNLCTLAGNPAVADSYTFVINAGTIIGSTDPVLPALSTGTCWANGSSLTLINNGSIYGKENGGYALGISYPITIDNTNGNIFGAGGGGGSGGSASIYPVSGGGGAGGLGQGYTNQSGPSGGSGGSADCQSQEGGAVVCASGGSGGAGGSWGSSGSGGSYGSGNYPGFTTLSEPSGGGPGGYGVVTMRGATISWIGGNNSTHLKGGISSTVLTQCADGIDNNGNGTIDTADSCGCLSEFDTTEYCAQCSDGIDNDANGATDMADTCACSAPSDDGETYDYYLCPFTGGTIICSELHRQGLMPDAWMQADKNFGTKMPALVMNGYHAWARPVVSLMQRSHAFTMFVYAFAHPWAQEMAYLEGVEDHGSFLGILVMFVGVPFSALVGLFVTPWW